MITKPPNRLQSVGLNAYKKLRDQSTCLTYLNHTKHEYKTNYNYIKHHD